MMIPITFGLALWLATPPPPSLADLEFQMAVEEGIMAEPGAAPPEPYRGLMERLGSNCYACREIATRKLKAASWFNRRWLFWGRKHRDPEVRLRCNGVIRKLNPCRACGGTGASPHYRGDACYECDGLGSVWRWSAWD